MSIFEGYDANGNIEDLTGTSYQSNRQKAAVNLVDTVASYRPSERMAAGRQMFKLGIGSIVAPIPGSMDEAIGTALVLAGVATIIHEGMKR